MASKSLSAKDIVLTSRPFWWITTAVPFLVGYLTHHVEYTPILLVGTLYFLLPYNLLMYGINDIFDYESDIRNPRKAGIEGALLAKHKHLPLFLVIAAINIPYWLYFISVGNHLSNMWLLIIVIMAFTYSLKGVRFKEIPLIDSLNSSFHYTSPFLFGVILATGQFGWLAAFAPFYIWAVGNHAFGAIQDIKPDKEAGIASIATKLGASKTILFSTFCYAVAAALPTVFFGFPAAPISLILMSYVFLAVRTLPYRKQSNHPIFHRSWQLLTYMNYGNGFLISAYLILLYRLGH